MQNTWSTFVVGCRSNPNGSFAGAKRYGSPATSDERYARFNAVVELATAPGPGIDRRRDRVHLEAVDRRVVVDVKLVADEIHRERQTVGRRLQEQVGLLFPVAALVADPLAVDQMQRVV